MTELGRVDAGLDLELLNRIDRRQGDVVVEVRVRVTDAVERVVVEEDALTTGGDGLRGALAAKSGARLPRRGREHVDVGRDGDQIQVLSAVQRQLGHDLVLDHRTERGALRVEQGGFTDDGHRLAERTDLQRHVHSYRLLDVDLEGRDLCGLEALQLDFQFIGAGRHSGEGVEPFRVGRGIARAPGGRVGHRDGGAGDSGTRRVCHRAGDPALRLRAAGHDPWIACREQNHYGEETCDRTRPVSHVFSKVTGEHGQRAAACAVNVGRRPRPNKVAYGTRRCHAPSLASFFRTIGSQAWSAPEPVRYRRS